MDPIARSAAQHAVKKAAQNQVKVTSGDQEESEVDTGEWEEPKFPPGELEVANREQELANREQASSSRLLTPLPSGREKCKVGIWLYIFNWDLLNHPCLANCEESDLSDVPESPKQTEKHSKKKVLGSENKQKVSKGPSTTKKSRKAN